MTDGKHLTYCTNVHPGSDWATTFANLKTYAPAIKARVCPDQPFGLGLWLSNQASEELAQGDRLTTFTSWLRENGLYVFTMNGFPYGAFHGQRVKDDVYSPDWTTDARLTHTKRLFYQLAQLLPDGVDGGISTCPISYRHWHDTPRKTGKTFEIAAKQLADLVVHLVRLASTSGKHLHLDIEPEPDGMLENSDEVVHFFTEYLLPIATPVLVRELELTDEAAQEKILKHINICYDVCHFSLAYEEPVETFAKLERAGIRIGKIQVSAALKILASDQHEAAIWSDLNQFVEPTYLHQVTEKTQDGVKTYRDLPDLLATKPNFTELRAHFHVPIFVEKFGALDSTQDQILKVIDYLKKNDLTNHLEIETYTWDVLPGELKKELTGSIIREINWFRRKLYAQ